LEAPIRAQRERIELRSAQPFELREHAQNRQHPGTELVLLRPSRRGVWSREQRRREVKAQARAFYEVLLDALDEAALGVQPRDLVLVLVSEHAEIVARDGVLQRTAAGTHALLDGGDASEPSAIALRVCAILITDEELLAP